MRLLRRTKTASLVFCETDARYWRPGEPFEVGRLRGMTELMPHGVVCIAALTLVRGIRSMVEVASLGFQEASQCAK